LKDSNAGSKMKQWKKRKMSWGTSKVWGCVRAVTWNYDKLTTIIQYEINLHNQTKKGNSCKLNTSGVMHLVRTNSNFIKCATF